jgi:CubicO group peptidase (beta-lactamase class C family)
MKDTFLEQPLSRRTLIKQAAITSFSLIAATSIQAQQEPASEPNKGETMDDKLKDLRARVKELMNEHQVPGVAIGLLLDGKPWAEGFGVTNLNNPQAVTGETLFQIGSTTKTFTATTAMLLSETGQLDLDKPVRHYLPTFRVQDETATQTVTVRQLLTHTSGWLGDFDLDTGDGDDALEKYVAAMADLPQIVPPGKLHMYSNSGFCVLGRIIEVIVGKPLDSIVREMLLTPLKLSDTVFWAHEAITKRTAVGHEMLGEATTQTVRPSWRLARYSHADGALASSALDQMRYAQAHLGLSSNSLSSNGLSGNVISAKVREHMQTPEFVSSPNEWVGLCWFISKHGELHLVRHGGSVSGFKSRFVMCPERQFAISCMTNAENGSALADEVTQFALEQFLGIQKVSQQPITLSTEQLAEYIGWYALPTGNPKDGVEIAYDGATKEKLTVRINAETFGPSYILPAVPMVPTGADLFQILAGPLKGEAVELVRDNSVVTFLRTGGRIAIREN